MSGSRIWWRVAEWALYYWALAITGCLPGVMSDQSDIMMISDQETASSVTWDDVSRPLTPHPAQPIISAGKWMVGERWKVVFRVYRVYSVHQTWSMAGRLVPCVHTRTLLTSPASPQLTPCQHLCRLTIMLQWLQAHEAVKQCLFILWLITLKFTAWVWTNRIEQLNGPCSHK